MSTYTHHATPCPIFLTCKCACACTHVCKCAYCMLHAFTYAQVHAHSNSVRETTRSVLIALDSYGYQSWLIHEVCTYAPMHLCTYDYQPWLILRSDS